MIINFIATHLFILINIISFSFILYILLNYKYRYSAHLWIFVLIIFPLGGIIIFLFFGRNWKTLRGDYALKVSKYYKKYFSYLDDKKIYQKKSLDSISINIVDNILYKKIIGFINKNQFSSFTNDNDIQIFFKGKENFENLKSDLRSATKQILMQYYIWRNDKLTSEIHEILIAKAKEGVEIKIIYDFVGSVFVNKSFVRKLRKNNIDVISNFKWEYIFKLYNLNHRDHRKIVVIDGEISYSGGMNMGQEYIDGDTQFNSWRDVNIKAIGSSVNFLKLLFATNWFFITNERLDYKFDLTKNNLEINKPIIQITSGPQLPWQSIKQIFCTVISNSSKYLYIQSPYFIPDATVIDLLTTTALTDVDVRLMITGKPDKYIPYFAAYSFMEPLLYAGVKIYFYEKGFLHAKMMVCESLTILGSANFDIRSFKLNYELSTIILDVDQAETNKKIFLRDIDNCSELTLDDYHDIHVWKKLRNSLCSLFYPIL